MTKLINNLLLRNCVCISLICLKKMKDGCISKLTITKTGHQATQYKKMIDTLLVLCTDKNFRHIDDVLHTWADLLEATFLPSYPDST